jgi:hypothetical protein
LFLQSTAGAKAGTGGAAAIASLITFIDAASCAGGSAPSIRRLSSGGIRDCGVSLARQRALAVSKAEVSSLISLLGKVFLLFCA